MSWENSAPASLVWLACAGVVLIQPALTRRLRGADAARRGNATLIVVGAVSVYGGYFADSPTGW